MVALTASPTVVAQYIFDKLTAAMGELGLSDVFLGDRDLISSTPTVCVIPGTTPRMLIGSANRTENRIETYLVVYQGALQDFQKNVAQGGATADRVITKIQSDLSLGGLVIYCYCTINEPGIANRGELMFASRLTFESVSRTMLPV